MKELLKQGQSTFRRPYSKRRARTACGGRWGTGVTSNLTIFDKATADSTDYDYTLRTMLEKHPQFDRRGRIKNGIYALPWMLSLRSFKGMVFPRLLLLLISCRLWSKKNAKDLLHTQSPVRQRRRQTIVIECAKIRGCMAGRIENFFVANHGWIVQMLRI